jgi:ABC-2 type transport system permease protein
VSAAAPGDLLIRRLRLLWRGWALQTKQMSTSGVFLLFSVITPVIWFTIAVFMFRSGSHPQTLMYATIGAGMMSTWQTSLIGSGQSLMRLREAGLLELLVAAPVPLVVVLPSITLGTATVGLYSLLATAVWGAAVFHIPLHVEHPLLLLAAVPATVLALGMLGVVLASVFVRFRYANAATNLAAYPVFLLSGMLVPIDNLPHWVRPISWVLPPTWGTQAIRDSVIGGGRPVVAIGACLALAAVYFGLGVLTVRKFEMLARRRASLALI